MGWLEKEKILHQRDEGGKLLPITVPLEELKQAGIEDINVLVIPAPRGELLRHWREIKAAQEDRTKTDALIEAFVISHIQEPKFTAEDFATSKFFTVKNSTTGKVEQMDLVSLLLNAINKASGIKTLEEAEAEVKKNSES